jgi:hypothetical protein
MIVDSDDMAYSNFSSTASATAPVMENNRRREFRRMVMRDGVITPFGDISGNSLRVVVVDIATIGVGLRTRDELPAGATYILSVPSHPEYDNLRLRVIRSRPSRGGQFEVGAEFC